MELEGKKDGEENVNGQIVKAFSIADLEIDDTAILTVRNVSRDGDLIGVDGVNPVTIELYSSGSAQAVKALRKAGVQMQKRLRDTIQNRIDAKDAERAERENVDKLTALTKRINNLPLDAEQLYSNPKLGFITKQVEAFIADDANFSKAPSRN